MKYKINRLILFLVCFTIGWNIRNFVSILSVRANERRYAEGTYYAYWTGRTWGTERRINAHQQPQAAEEKGQYQPIRDQSARQDRG